jgi:glycosyltransferase involved in cell wall biosynthesis
VCIVSRRPDLLAACLESLASQLDPPPFEVLVCATAPGVHEAARNTFPGVHVASAPGARPGAGRNVLVSQARGDLLLFVDDDVVVRLDMLHRLVELAERHPDRAVFGGPNATPPRSSKFQHVQGAVLASIVTSGPVRRRYGEHPSAVGDERWFILCNLAIRREVMAQFPPDLVCAEENAVLGALAREGHTMLYDPALVVYHERRADWVGFAKQMHLYGRGRGQLMARDRDSVRVAYLLPTAACGYLVAVPVLAWLSPLFALPALAYSLAVAAAAIRVGSSVRRWRSIPLAAALILSVHLAYGSGVLRGLTGRRRSVAAPDVQWTLASADEP